MGKLQTGRFERLGARTYSIKGPGAMVDLDETVLGVLLLERQGGMESHMIQAWDTFQALASQAAVAGNYRWALLSNPPGSGRIAVLDWFSFSKAGVSSTVNVEIYMGLGVPPGFAVAHTGYPVDSRIPNSRQAACSLYQLTSTSTPFGTLIGEVDTSQQQEFRVVLGEDGSVFWRTRGHAQEMILTVRWAERDAAPFEQ